MAENNNVRVLYSCQTPPISSGTIRMRFHLDGAGETFAPVLVVSGSPTILWTFEDSTTSDSATPSKAYTGAQYVYLTVSPWSALTTINLGYDASDGGSESITIVENQHVDEIKNLWVARSSLDTFCASYNPMTSLDFSNFAHLATIEVYNATALTTINLSGCSALSRLCIESAIVETLDLSDCPLIADVRAANNGMLAITFASTLDHLWHFCAGGNNFTTLPYALMTAVRQLWVDNGKLGGSIALVSQVLSSVWFYNNIAISAIDLSGALFAADFALDMHGCTALASVTYGACGATTINLNACALTQSAIATLLAAIVSSGATNGTLDIAGTGNALLDSAAQASKATLVAAGWTIADNGNVVGSAPATPTNLAATTTASTASLTWDAMDGATSYGVYRCDTESGTYVLIGSPTTNAYADEGLTASTGYYYKVLSTNSYGSSALSAALLVTTASAPTIVTSGDATNITVWTSAATEVTVHWSDGTTEVATISEYHLFAKTGLGTGSHSHWLSADVLGNITKIGGYTTGGSAHTYATSYANLNLLPNLNTVRDFTDGLLTSIGRINAIPIATLALGSNSGMSAATNDQITEDLVAGGAANGTWYYSSAGFTSASAANRATLVANGWTLEMGG